MAILKFIILTLILTGAQSALADDPIAPIVTNTTTVAPVVTNATTTVAPVVTNATTTTVAPVETTTKPTEKPTTKPTPAPGPIITTTPTPVIPWPANEYTWIVEQDNVTCIKLMGAFELILPYKIDKAGNDTTLKNAILPIPKTTKATGQCGIDTQTITLNWNCSNTQQISNQLTFHFGVSRNKTTPYPDVTVGKWGLINITGEVHIDSNCFPNATETNSTIIIDIIDHLVTYQSSINHSYKCIAKESLKDKSGQELKLSDLQVEAFRSGSGDNFGAAQECALDGVTDVVPIAVGASLAGLVVIVLIAYLFGRRRSRARGYQSV